VSHVASIRTIKNLHSKFCLDKPKIIQPLLTTQKTHKDNIDMAVIQITCEELD
jgi:hypothetical protein